MNPEYYYKQENITIIAKLGLDNLTGVAAYVAVTSLSRPTTCYVNGYMDCAVAHHPVLSMFDSWDHADCSYDPSIPVIIVW